MGSKRKSSEKKERKLHETKTKKRKRSRKSASHEEDDTNRSDVDGGTTTNTVSVKEKNTLPKLPFDYKYIVAPMVGASELPFRILARKYGAQLIYTPMMLASQFATSEEYRKKEFQTTSFDRPLVCHFAANNGNDFATAAKLAEPHCDAIDLNLGCPQRTAYVGHFGSYLLDEKERPLVLRIVRAGVEAVRVPVFVKIRLLDTFEDTLRLVRELYDAGASLVTVHARYRATFHRKGPGARDGPALLDQVQKLKEAFPDKLLITNGNTITYDDVVNNLKLTKADGIMSAEGILDNPALYLGRLGSREEPEKQALVKGGNVLSRSQKFAKLLNKLRKIEKIEMKATEGNAELSTKEKKKLKKKNKVQSKMTNISADDEGMAYSTANLGDLYEASDDKVGLALEYLQIVRLYPAIMRTVIFHTRRMIKAELTTYQLMDDCLKCTTLDEVETLVRRIQLYNKDPSSFQYDTMKAKREKEALERKRREEGKRKEYEARMMRKAKREGRTDLDFYLRQGSAVPTSCIVEKLKTLSREDQMTLWKEQGHSQHCLSFHLNGDCQRGRACAFLHVPCANKYTFEERDEVAG